MRRGWCGLFLLLGLVDCRPSRESMSAGQVGCPPDEVTISGEESSMGFGQSSETWVAECRGQTFICTQINTGSKSAVDTDVSCRSEVGSEPSVASSERAEPKPQAKPVAAPTGGAGFELGSTTEAAKKACEAAGHTWESSGAKASCSGAATSLGFDAGVAFDLCRDRICKITIAHSPESKWTSALAELKTKLIEKYGAPFDSEANLPPPCRSDAELLACFEKGLLLRFTWSWKSGEKLNLTAGKPKKSEGPAAIRIEYARPASALGADPSAL